MGDKRMAEGAFARRSHRLVTGVDRAVLFFSRHWLAFANVILGLWMTLPWLAPVLMHVGAIVPAKVLYFFYGVQCHQLPQRSYFLFGSQLMIPLNDILHAYPANNPLLLRAFIGSQEMGWKVAWSDRMVSLHGGLFLGGSLFALTGRRWRPLPAWGWIVLTMPMILDGSSHFVNDILGADFRDSNAWLSVLTGQVLAPAFYAGDFLGSFNWWMRLLSGLMAGFAAIALVYPHLNASFNRMEQTLFNPPRSSRGRGPTDS
jgi:hypothetical protein